VADLSTRDQQAIGEAILNRDREKYPKASTFANKALYGIALPEFPKDELLSSVTRREYIARLERKAFDEGDHHAYRRLVEMDNAYAARLPSRKVGPGDFDRVLVPNERDAQTLAKRWEESFQEAGIDTNGDLVDPDPGDADVQNATVRSICPVCHRPVDPEWGFKTMRGQMYHLKCHPGLMTGSGT
jgi:hypothetical protein